MTRENRIDLKFYVTLLLGFSLLIIGCFIEPTGHISSSVLVGAGMILTISAGIMGIDLAKIMKEFRLMKNNFIEIENPE